MRIIKPGRMRRARCVTSSEDMLNKRKILVGTTEERRSLGRLKQGVRIVLE
jgi:hypothetical protein